MRISLRSRPRRRDPRRRFRNRLLIGMVGVALLPLVAFAVLAIFELDTVARSTANATESAILQRQQARQQAALSSRAAQIGTRVDRIDTQILALATELSRQLESAGASTPLPKGLTAAPGGAVTYLGGRGSQSSLAISSRPGATDGRFAAASGSAQVQSQAEAVLKGDPEVSAVWFEDETTSALRAFPGFDVTEAIDTKVPRYDPSRPGLRDEIPVLSNSASAPGGSASGPYWTDAYPLLKDGASGVSAWFKLADGRTLVGVDISPAALIGRSLASGSDLAGSSLVVSASGMVMWAGTDLVGTYGPDNGVGTVLSVPGQPHLASALRRVETTAEPPRTPITANLNHAAQDVFTAPIFGSHWVLASPVAVSDLEPNLSSLTLGVNDSVHRLFPVMVLPVLVLLVGLAFIATTLLSRRMYLPVQALTDHAVLEERNRLAREIHDTLAQQLTGIVLELEAADTLLDRGSERGRTSVEKARELARGALQEARRSVWNLRPAPLAATGLVAAIGHEVEAWEERTGIPARFKARAVPRHPSLTPTAEVALLRIGQEALSNAARHGRPEHVEVELRAQRQELVLSVRDDGVGFDPAASTPREDCYGLEGMAERARNAGGTLTVMSTPGHGTTVTTRLPLTEAGVEADTA